MLRLFCCRRRLGNGDLSPCEHREAGYGKALSQLPHCPVCALPIETPAADDQELLALLDAVVADPVGHDTITFGWDAVQVIATERGRPDLVSVVERLRREHVLGPAFHWSVHAERGGLVFTRRAPK